MKFKTPAELEKKVNKFFEVYKDEPEKCTVTRLAVYLDTSRETLMDYEYKDEYSDTIKRAKAKIAQFYEDRLISRGNA